MKTRPELEVIPLPHDPCHPDRQVAFPALQEYAAGSIDLEKCHDHILRAALLAKGVAVTEPYKH
jgi:hypothetical protein